MGLPAGFKPNPNLDNFLGNFILDQISLWNYVTARITLIEPYVVKCIGLSGFMGASFFLAMCHDVLFFSSSYVFILYTMIAIAYKYTLRMIGTLIMLFRGKKFNIISKRVESNNFTIQELYLGVVIVTLLIFLTPTIAMYYYICFILIIVSVLIVQIILLNMQNLTSNFPYFLLTYALMNPYSLPNSIRMEICSKKKTLRLVANKCNKASVFHRLVD
jgi:phosphatidylinositol glycan class Q protein